MERYFMVAKENQKHNLLMPFLLCILLLWFPLFSGDRKPYRNRNCKSFRVLCGIYQCDFIAGSVFAGTG